MPLELIVESPKQIGYAEYAERQPVGSEVRVRTTVSGIRRSLILAGNDDRRDHAFSGLKAPYMQAGGMSRTTAETLVKAVIRLANSVLLRQAGKSGAKCFRKGRRQWYGLSAQLPTCRKGAVSRLSTCASSVAPFPRTDTGNAQAMGEERLHRQLVFSKISRPISIRRISLVPALIS